MSVSQIALCAEKFSENLILRNGSLVNKSKEKEIQQQCIDHFIILWGPHFLQTAIKRPPKIAKVIRKFWTGSGVEYQLSRLRKGFTLIIWIRGWDSYNYKKSKSSTSTDIPKEIGRAHVWTPVTL